ncbi:hypothetical protein D3C85_1701790 [compost metagenome]
MTGGMVGADMMLYGLLLMIVIRWEPRGLMALLERRSAAPARASALTVKPVGQTMGGTR